VDTRSKIVTPEAAMEAARRAREQGKPVAVVTGYFDPLTAAHARRLEEIEAGARHGALIAVVGEPVQPVLPARARAELVAALRAVDYVVISEEPAPPEWIERLAPDAVFREEAADEVRTGDLIQHVQSRHQ
jgi:bifunctional ADP-heptose synthase (sugar kinase/adenylyltransferase)